MLARLLKCPVCEQYGHKEDMIHEEDKRYYHKEYCHERWMKDKEATRIENEQWDALYQYIVKLHDIIELPMGNVSRLRNLRAGYDIEKGVKIRKWRTGPDYGLMLEAYKLCESINRQNILGKTSDWKIVKQVNYTISTMRDYLNDAWRIRQNKFKQQAVEKRVEKQESNKDQNYKNKNTYMSKNDELDISDFL